MRPPSLERRVLDALPVTVYAVDPEGRATYVTRPGAQPADDHAALGAAIWDVVGDPAMRLQLDQAMAALRQGGAAASWELPLHSHGRDGPHLVQIAPLLEGRTVTGYVVTT